MDLSPRCEQPLPADPAFQAFCCWDCGWFERVAREGYRPLEYAQVLQLLPSLGRSVAEISGLLPRTALSLLANLASFLLYLVPHRLFCRLGTVRTERFAFFWAPAHSTH